MKTNLWPKTILTILFLMILTAACTIPFYFESPSIFYKTGADKLMLRTGKIFGIITAILMILQLFFIGRFSILESVFSLKTLFQWHRANGLLLLATAIIHPVLILGADHFVFFGVEFKYWPELTGVGLLALLLFFVGVSFWQKKLNLNYKTWRWLHRILAPVILSLMLVHVFNVSRTFESGPPYYGLGCLGAVAGLILLKKYLLK